MNDIRINIIEYGSEVYQASLILRNAILRVPIGLCLFDEDLSAEADDIHIAAFDGDTLVGILILTHVSDDSVQMRQVAVREDLRGHGVGRKMVAFAERTAKDAGCREMTLHARKAPVAFYERLGYAVRGDMFIEVGIKHREMYKQL